MERRFNSGPRRGGGFGPKPPVREGEVLEVEIEAVGEKGDGIARKDGFVLFVPGVKEGDRVKVKVTRVLRKVGFAEVVGEGAEEAPAEEASEEASEEAPEEEMPAEEEPEPEVSAEDTEDFGEESAEEESFEENVEEASEEEMPPEEPEESPDEDLEAPEPPEEEEQAE